MTRDRKCAVVFATDARPYDLTCLGYALRSIDRHMTAPHDTFVLTEDKSVRFEGDATVLDPAPALGGVGISGSEWARSRWPFAAVYRLAIPLMPELAGYDRAVYFDTDVLASAELDGMLTLDMRGHEVVGAVENLEGNRGDDRSSAVVNALSPHAVSAMRAWLWGDTPLLFKPYLNSGVLLWNLSKIAENGMDWYIRRLTWAWPGIRHDGGFRFPINEFTNYMMDSAALLSDRYNAFSYYETAGTSIIHYVCSKPDMIKRALRWYGPDPYDPETKVVTQFHTRVVSVDVNELFKRSFVISVPQDEGRRNAFFNNLRDGGVTTDPALFLGLYLRQGRVPAFGVGELHGGRLGTAKVLGCGLSHLAAICAAKALGWPNVLVFEDDARFATSCDIRSLEKVLSNVPARTASIYLGVHWTHEHGARPYRVRGFPDLIEFDIARCSHAYVSFNDWYDSAIDIYTHSSVTSDHDVMNYPEVPDRLKPKAPGLYHTVFNLFNQCPADTSPEVKGWVPRPDTSGEGLDETAEKLSDNWPYFSFGPDGIRHSDGPTIPRDGNAEEGDFYMNVFCLVRVARALGLRFVRARGCGKTYTIPSAAFDTVAPFTVDAQTPRVTDALAPFLDGNDNGTNEKKETTT